MMMMPWDELQWMAWCGDIGCTHARTHWYVQVFVVYLNVVGGVIDEKTGSSGLANVGVAEVDPWCLAGIE